MSLFQEMQAYATEAQAFFGELSGLDPNATGNTILPGSTTPVMLTYGTARVFVIPVPGGGYRKRIETQATMTRAQAQVPKEMTKIVRTDQTPPITYVVDWVDTTDPVDYIMGLVVYGP